MPAPRPEALSFGFLVICAALITYTYVHCKRATRTQTTGGSCYSSNMMKLYHGEAKQLKTLSNGFTAAIYFPEPFIYNDYLTFIAGDILIDYEQLVHEKKLDSVTFTAQGCCYYHDPQITSVIPTDLYILSFDSVQRDMNYQNCLVCAGAVPTTRDAEDCIEVKIFRISMPDRKNVPRSLPEVEVLSSLVLDLGAPTAEGTKIYHCFDFSSNIISGIIVDPKDDNATEVWYIWSDNVNKVTTDDESIKTPPDRVKFIPLDVKTCLFSLKHATPGARVYRISVDVPQFKSFEISSTGTNVEIALFPNVQHENMLLAVYLSENPMTEITTLRSKILKVGYDGIEEVVIGGVYSDIWPIIETNGAPYDHALGRLSEKGDSIPLYVLLYNQSKMKLTLVACTFKRGVNDQWNWEMFVDTVYSETNFIFTSQLPPKINIILDPTGPDIICILSNGKVIAVQSFTGSPDNYHVSRQARPSEEWQCSEIFFPIDDLTAFSIITHNNSNYLRMLVSDEVYYNTVGI